MKSIRMLILATVFALLGTSAQAAPLLTKKVYRTAKGAALHEAAYQMTRMLSRIGYPGVVRARYLKAEKLGTSPMGRAIRFIVSSPGDIPGDYKLSVLKVKDGWRAYKVGTAGAR